MEYEYLDDFYEDYPDSYEAVRDVLADQYQDLPPEQLEDLLLEVFEGVEPDDMEDFFRSLSQFGRQAGQTLQRAAPGILQGAVTGAAAGSAAGPYGALIGALGGATIGGITSATQPQGPRRPGRPPPAPGPAPPRPSPAAPIPRRTPIATSPPRPAAQGSPAATQLLQLLANPTVLQGLMAMAMGSAGRSSVTVGNNSVPLSAITNLLTQVAARATAEANLFHPGEGIPDYVMDSTGEFLVDPASEEERAMLLYQMLNDEAIWEDYDDYDDADYEIEDFEEVDDEEEWYFDDFLSIEFDVD